MLTSRPTLLLFLGLGPARNEYLTPRRSKFPRYDMKILLGDFNAKVGTEDIFKPTIGNES
jgi:hypothetical protein